MGIEKQVCPLCGADNPLDERTCAICGAQLTGKPKPVVSSEETQPQAAFFYSFSDGEDDLMAARAPLGVWLLVVVFLSWVLLAAAVLYAALRFGSGGEAASVARTPPTDTVTPDYTFTALALTFNPPTLTPSLTPTHTLPPPLPTITLTPTEGPCEVTVKEGDTLYGLALVCGHRDLAIVQEIVSLNNLSCESCLQVGQVIQIPRPTPTLDLTVIVDPSSGALNVTPNDTVALVSEEVSADDLIATRQIAAEPTLDPNLQYITIQKGQTLYDIVAIYNADVKLLSEINPEVDFPQCDFGERFGGPTCAVFFYEGQRIRVPAPTATPTLPPTPSGSETPTPTATPTINVPTAFSPQDGAQFDATSLVTLRWQTTGTLGINQAYLVRVKNVETEQEFAGLTCDLAFDITADWQGQENKFYEYTWTVSVVDLSEGAGGDYAVRRAGFLLCTLSFNLPVDWNRLPSNVPDAGVITDVTLSGERYTTAPRRFFWQGKGK